MNCEDDRARSAWHIKQKYSDLIARNLAMHTIQLDIPDALKDMLVERSGWMIAYEKTVKVSAKGQITLPKAVRQKLATALVRVVIDDDAVRIEPVPDLAGSLQQYAQQYIPHEEAREQAWSEVVHEKTPRD